MTSLKGDKIKFKVFYRDQATGSLKRFEFDSFAAAAGMASALDGMTRFIDAEFYNNDSNWSSSMYCYSKIDNQRKVCNPYFVRQVLKFMEASHD